MCVCFREGSVNTVVDVPVVREHAVELVRLRAQRHAALGLLRDVHGQTQIFLHERCWRIAHGTLGQTTVPNKNITP